MIKNISVIRGCNFNCVYCCAIKNPFYLSTGCGKCHEFIPHFHNNILNKSPPKSNDELITIGISSDISFFNKHEIEKIISYVTKWSDRNFVVISKNPEFFLKYKFPLNVIIATTIETNKGKEINFNYSNISKAPYPEDRIVSMQKLKCSGNKLMIVIEPIIIFDLIPLVNMIKSVNPFQVRIGYDKFYCNLPEPSIIETEKLIFELEKFTSVVKMHI